MDHANQQNLTPWPLQAFLQSIQRSRIITTINYPNIREIKKYLSGVAGVKPQNLEKHYLQNNPNTGRDMGPCGP